MIGCSFAHWWLQHCPSCCGCWAVPHLQLQLDEAAAVTYVLHHSLLLHTSTAAPAATLLLLHTILTAVCCFAAPLCFCGESIAAVCIAGPCHAKVGAWRPCLLVTTRAEAAHGAWCARPCRAGYCCKGARGAHCVCSTAASGAGSIKLASVGSLHQHRCCWRHCCICNALLWGNHCEELNERSHDAGHISNGCNHCSTRLLMPCPHSTNACTTPLCCGFPLYAALMCYFWSPALHGTHRTARRFCRRCP
jgi:hypothetical protein